MTGAAGRGVSFSQRAQRRDLLPSRRPGQSPARLPGSARPNRPRPARLPLAPMAALGGARRRPLVLLLFGETPGGGRGIGVRRLRGGCEGPRGPGGRRLRERRTGRLPGAGSARVPGGDGGARGGSRAPEPASGVRWRRLGGFSALRFASSPWGLRWSRRAASGCTRDEDGAGLGPRGGQGGRRPRPGEPVLRALPLALRAGTKR